MSAKKTSRKTRKSAPIADISDRLEQVFLAGLGALTTASEIGAKTFESLVDQGQAYSKKASDRTGELIDEVQEAVREVTAGAQGRAAGLIDQVRESSEVSRLHDVFDNRVEGALKRIGVPTQKDIDVLHAKLDRLIDLVDGKPAKPAAKKRAAKKTSVKKTPVKKAPVKKASVKKAPVKKASVKKAAVKKTPVKKAAVKKAVSHKSAPEKSAPGKAAPKNAVAQEIAVGKTGPMPETSEQTVSQ